MYSLPPGHELDNSFSRPAALARTAGCVWEGQRPARPQCECMALSLQQAALSASSSSSLWTEGRGGWGKGRKQTPRWKEHSCGSARCTPVEDSDRGPAAAQAWELPWLRAWLLTPSYPQPGFLLPLQGFQLVFFHSSYSQPSRITLPTPHRWWLLKFLGKH